MIPWAMQRKTNPDTNTFVQEEKRSQETAKGTGQNEGQRTQEGQWLWQKVSRNLEVPYLLIYCSYYP